MADPYTIYLLIEMNPGTEIDYSSDMGPPTVLSMISDDESPFKSALLVWETLDLGFLDSSEKEPETYQDWLEHHIRTKETRYTPEGTQTGFMILKEDFHPGVETLDSYNWTVVDLSREEYDKLLELYRMSGSA
jgi:hypothetical protein